MTRYQFTAEEMKEALDVLVKERAAEPDKALKTRFKNLMTGIVIAPIVGGVIGYAFDGPEGAMIGASSSTLGWYTITLPGILSAKFRKMSDGEKAAGITRAYANMGQMIENQRMKVDVSTIVSALAAGGAAALVTLPYKFLGVDVSPAIAAASVAITSASNQFINRRDYINTYLDQVKIAIKRQELFNSFMEDFGPEDSA